MSVLFVGFDVVIDVAGIVYFAIGSGAGVGLVIVGLDMGLEVYGITVGLRRGTKISSWV